MTLTATAHILLDERGTAWVDDTNVKVVEVVADKLAHGSTPEEMHLQYPNLSVAQIYAALAYYHDHRNELDEKIERSMLEYNRLKAAAVNSPGQTKLRNLGMLR